MILRFKKDSEAEKAIKEMIFHRDQSLELAKSIVKESIGIEPVGFGHSYFCTISYSWSCNMTAFDESEPDVIHGMTFVKNENGFRIYKPNKKTSKGKEIANKFQFQQIDLRTDSKSLEKFGIFTENGLRYSAFQIGKDEISYWIALSDICLSWLKPHKDVTVEIN